MKFVSIIRATVASLNPFARIRDLEGQLAAETAAANTYIDLFIERGREASSLRRKLRLAEMAIEVQDAAIDAFMAEREELKFNIALRDQAGIQLTAELLYKDAEEANTAGDIVETIGYVRAVETALNAVGIFIADGENGPVVQVLQNEFVGAVLAGEIEQLAA